MFITGSDSSSSLIDIGRWMLLNSFRHAKGEMPITIFNAPYSNVEPPSFLRMSKIIRASQEIITHSDIKDKIIVEPTYSGITILKSYNISAIRKFIVESQPRDKEYIEFGYSVTPVMNLTHEIMRKAEDWEDGYVKVDENIYFQVKKKEEQ
jgi:hypothetical protein